MEEKIITVKNAEGDPDTQAKIIHEAKIDYVPKVSVIIPVYNTEKYLRQCLDSVVNQTLKEIEIICVDDGSTDNSLEILKEYAQKDSRFTILTQENLHAGVARNAGLVIAKGEYLSFLDSDDWLEVDMLQEMVENLISAKSEVCCCQYNNFNETLKTFEEVRGINCCFEQNKSHVVKRQTLGNKLYVASNPMPWNKLFSREFIKRNKIFFQSLASSNDIFFSMASFTMAEKIAFIMKPLVNYRYNRINSLRNSRDKHPLSFYYAYKGLNAYIKKLPNNIEFQRPFYEAFLSTCLWTLNNTLEKRSFVKNFIKETIIPEFLLLEENKKYIQEFLYNKFLSRINFETIVSMTSYPARIDSVHLVVDSILRQTITPDKIILWLAPEQFPNKEADLPKELLDLKEKGLTIDWYHDIRSYKKLIPTLKKYPESIIVTADDDNIYPKQWLEKLYNSYLKYPNDIHAHRITKFFYKHGFEFIAGGQDYYKKPSYLNKLVGLGGVLYPLNCFYKDILNEELFMKLAPTNDDQWFWFQAVLNGTKVRVVENPEIQANYIEGTQEVGLTNINDKGKKLFWKDFNRLIEYYPQLKGILIKESRKMKAKNFGTIDRYKNDLEAWYKRVSKKDLDLVNPKTFNEKIQWLKLYDSTPIKTQLADKYLVREWVKEKIGEEYLIPLLGVWDKFDDIDFDKLPSQFAIKPNHGSYWKVICTDKNSLDLEEVGSNFKNWMSINFAFRNGVELHYKNILPKIICEQYIESSEGYLPDYRFFCFNGKIECVQVDDGGPNNPHGRSFYTKDWKMLDYIYNPQDWHKHINPIERPKNFEKMCKLAEILSKDFNFVRVDLYNVNGRIYFGEMTFTPCSGAMKWSNEKINKKFGKKIKLPKIAYNVDTGEYYKLPFPWKYYSQNIFSLKNDHRGTHKILTILGLKLKCKRRQKGKIGMLERIFSVKNRESNNHTWYKVIRILGLKFSFKNKNLTLRKSIEYQREVLDNQANIISVQNNNIAEINNEIKKQFEIIKEQNNELKKEIGNLKNKAEVQNARLTQFDLKSKFEIERCKCFVQEIYKLNIQEKYKKLINNLDDLSVSLISSILSRVTCVANSHSSNIDIFTEEEKRQIEKIKKEFSLNIFKISEECYAYKKYLLPIRHFEPSVFYYKHDIDNLMNLDKIRSKSIIDVGAFVGDSAIVMQDYTDEKVYSFEPTDENYNLMLKTIDLNESNKIVPVKYALGSKEEELEIYMQGSGSSVNRVIFENPEKETIPVTTLDKYVRDNNIEVGLIKVDIEGFEQEFLKGAINTIKEQKPTLLISIYHNASDFFDIKPMIETWNLGYKFKIVKPVDGSIRGEILLIAEQE